MRCIMDQKEKMDEQTQKDKKDWLNGNTFLTMNHVKN